MNKTGQNIYGTKLEGIASVPVFHAAGRILGDGGVIIFVLTLLGALFTGILGNSFAFSRLMLAMAREEMLPQWMGKTDGKHMPRNVIPFLMIVSIPIPFLGRSVIALLFLIFFTTTLWTRQVTHHTTERVLYNYAEYHRKEFAQYGLQLDRRVEVAANGFLKRQMGTGKRCWLRALRITCQSRSTSGRWRR